MMYLPGELIVTRVCVSLKVDHPQTALILRKHWQGCLRLHTKASCSSPRLNNVKKSTQSWPNQKGQLHVVFSWLPTGTSAIWLCSANKLSGYLQGACPGPRWVDPFPPTQTACKSFLFFRSPHSSLQASTGCRKPSWGPEIPGMSHLDESDVALCFLQAVVCS